MLKIKLKNMSRELAVLAALLLLIVVFSILDPIYLTTGNMVDIIKQATINGILAIGMTCVILTGGIDLSIGCTFAIVIVATGSMVAGGMPSLLSIILGALLGCVMGGLNGVLITKMNLQPFIATLGTMSAYRGLAYVVTGGWPVLGIPDEYRKIFTTKLMMDVPISVLVLFAIAILASVVLKKTRFGNYIYSVRNLEVGIFKQTIKHRIFVNALFKLYYRSYACSVSLASYSVYSAENGLFRLLKLVNLF